MKVFFLWVTACVAFALSGCGTKGDLYLPEKQPVKQDSSAKN